MNDFKTRLLEIQNRLESACSHAGRDVSQVQLVAVSKTQPAERLLEAWESGQTLFGENRVQELLQKKETLPSGMRWHLIGPLQSNKVRKILPHVEMIHSVDSLAIARDIQRIAKELGLFPQVLLEVNVATEASKHGFSVDELKRELEELYALDRLYIQGLMCIPPFQPRAEDSRPYFTKLRNLRDDLEKAGGAPLPQLSMGMSHDFEIAIEEGATLVRVGTALFGQR